MLLIYKVRWVLKQLAYCIGESPFGRTLSVTGLWCRQCNRGENEYQRRPSRNHTEHTLQAYTVVMFAMQTWRQSRLSEFLAAEQAPHAPQKAYGGQWDQSKLDQPRDYRGCAAGGAEAIAEGRGQLPS
jgi:hypothetical protein